MLFATQLIANSSGFKARIAILDAIVQTCPQVMGILANRVSTSSAVLNKAALMTSAVSSPSEDQSFIAPSAPCTLRI